MRGRLASRVDALLEIRAALGFRTVAAEPVVGPRQLPRRVEVARVGRERGAPDPGRAARARRGCAVRVEASLGATCAASESRGYRIRGCRTLIRKLLTDLGEDPDREGLRDTPKRVEKAYKFLTSGYSADIDQVLNNALFTVDYNEMVIVKDIDFYSLCEHHLLPFFGKCHVAYIPSNKVIGLSKIPRLVDVFARRLQVQERLTNQIADTIRDKIAPLGVAVVIEATHLCMSMRGVEKQNSFAVTSAMQGALPRQRAHADGVPRADQAAQRRARHPGAGRLRVRRRGVRRSSGSHRLCLGRRPWRRLGWSSLIWLHQCDTSR